MISYFYLPIPKHDQVSKLKDPKFIFRTNIWSKKVDFDSWLAKKETVTIPSRQKSRQLILVTNQELVTLCSFFLTSEVLWAVLVERFTNFKTS